MVKIEIFKRFWVFNNFFFRWKFSVDFLLLLLSPAPKILPMNDEKITKIKRTIIEANMPARYVLSLVDPKPVGWFWLVNNFFRVILISLLIHQLVHRSVSISIQTKMLLNLNSCLILKVDYPWSVTLNHQLNTKEKLLSPKLWWMLHLVSLLNSTKMVLMSTKLVSPKKLPDMVNSMDLNMR